MECRSVIDSLSDYLDGSLAVQQAQSIEAHLHQCPPCNVVRTDLSAICIAAQEMPLRTPSKALWTRIQNEIELEQATAVGKAAPQKSNWLKSWSDRKFTFTLPQLAGASALAFSLMVFGMYHTFHDQSSTAPSSAATTVLPSEVPWQSKVQQKMERINARSASWSPETKATYDNHLQRIDTSMIRLRQNYAVSKDTDQEKLLMELYNEKLQLMEDFERFEK